MKIKFFKFSSIIALPLFLFSCSKGICVENLPKPTPMGGIIGKQFGVDANINMETIDTYLDMKGVIYRDMRMLVDPIDYEDMGGDKYLSGFIKGFSICPLPYLLPTEPPEGTGGHGYDGPTLFKENNGVYLPMFSESISIIKNIFPQDKVIFLMCGGGGYAYFTKNLLVGLGYDKDKIYNLGGYWTYRGNNSISTIVGKDKDDKNIYNFSNVPYFNIDVNGLHEINYEE